MHEVVQRTHGDSEHIIIPATLATSYTARTRQAIPAEAIPTFGRREIRILPFGAGNAGQTIRAAIIGWSMDRGLGTPMMLAITGSMTLGGVFGVAGNTPSEVERWVDVVTVTGYARACSGGGLWGSLIVETLGCEFIEVQMNRNTAASAGALVARV